jgi:hypothetical protein
MLFEVASSHCTVLGDWLDQFRRRVAQGDVGKQEISNVAVSKLHRLVLSATVRAATRNSCKCCKQGSCRVLVGTSFEIPFTA